MVTFLVGGRSYSIPSDISLRKPFKNTRNSLTVPLNDKIPCFKSTFLHIKVVFIILKPTHTPDAYYVRLSGVLSLFGYFGIGFCCTAIGAPNKRFKSKNRNRKDNTVQFIRKNIQTTVAAEVLGIKKFLSYRAFQLLLSPLRLIRQQKGGYYL